MKNIKKLLLVMGGMMFMTNAMGCIGTSDRKVENMFNDFTGMFPSKDLTFLYDKEGEVSSEDGKKELNDNSSISNISGLGAEDKGSWNISSYFYTEQSTKNIGVSINFNRNIRKAKGILIIDENEQEFEYPIYYEKGKLYLVDEENTPKDVKEKLENFKMMYEFIELDKKYLNSLKLEDTRYNANAPLFTADYKFKENDKNINKIKEIYPELKVDEENCKLRLFGKGTPWNTTGRIELMVSLDQSEESYFTAAMSFGGSSVLSEEDIDE